MMHIEEYCTTKGISRRWVKELINRGEVPSEKINGQRYIIAPPTVNAPSVDPKKFREEIREYVSKAGVKYVAEALRRVREYEKAHCVKLKGLSSKVLYKIAAQKASVHHKRRSDAGAAKNSALKASQEKVEALAAALYIGNGEPSVRFITTRVKELAQQNESIYEIASIPQPTLYRHIRNFIKVNKFKGSWEYYNRHKDFLKKLPSVQGAFTDNIEFMDYIAFDDRKADVAGSYWLDPVDGKMKLRKVWYWIAIEMLTMMPVGWVILPREPNSEDVISVLLQSMLQYGLPKKGYLFDNGIGYSERVQKFMERVKLQSAGSGYFTSPFKPVAPYEPTHKANIERFNRFIKSEHDAGFKNFVGGQRSEVRHSGKRLSPEECDHLVTEYISSADAYLTGDCIKRKRDRVINSAKRHASIADLWNDLSKSCEPYFLSEESLRWALMDDTQIRKYNGSIRITRQGVSFDYIAGDYMPALEGREFITAMMPTDMSRMDIYATENFVDHHTGAMYEKGQYVATLHSMRAMPAAELQERVFKSRKEAGKHARMMKAKLLDAALAQFPELIAMVNTRITIDGEALDVRKKLLERMNGVTESMPIGSIAEYIKGQCAEIATGKPAMELTNNESTDNNSESLTLTVEGVEIPK